MDSSALFAAVLSPTGAARELIRLAIGERIQLVISQDVITETRRNIGLKAPQLQPLIEQLFVKLNFEVVTDPSRKEVKVAEAYVAQKDAIIIAAAISANVDYLATFDRKHLIDPPEVSKKSGLNIGTAGTILYQIRNTID